MKQRVLLFSKAIPNSGRNLEPSTSDLAELSAEAEKAVQDLGQGWTITSASTQVSHFTMGNLETIGLLLTVVASS